MKGEWENVRYKVKNLEKEKIPKIIQVTRMELMPTASRYLLELKSFRKLSLKFYISRYLFFKKLKRLQILCDFQNYM